MSKPFITLEQFLSLPDSTYEPDRPYSKVFSGEEWIFRYNLAKEQWEKYGDNPPIGSEVMVLVNGHDTTTPELTKPKHLDYCARRIISAEEDQFFKLTKPDKKTYDRDSCVDKAFWWRSMAVINKDEQKSTTNSDS